MDSLRFNTTPSPTTPTITTLLPPKRLFLILFHLSRNDLRRLRHPHLHRPLRLPRRRRRHRQRPRSLIVIGVFDENGKLLGSSSSPIQIWKDGDCVEQSSTDIWHAISAAVKAACSLAEVSGDEVKGLGFAATCSLVAVDADGSPVTVSWSGDSRRNIIVWMDHRAVEQAERINSRNSPVLQYCGGALSPEMQPPKLLWVKENLPESWSMVFRWMDLSDWLSYRATGDDTRSLCTTVCKWTYLGHAHMQQNNEKDSRDMEACGWDDDFWEEIGLGDLVEGHHAKIGRSVAFPGHPLGSGLTSTAAKARYSVLKISH